MSDLMMGLIALVFGQIAGFAVQALVLEQWRKNRALRRLRGEYRVGTICNVVRDSSGGPALLGRSVIHSITKGRVEFREINEGKRSLVVTGREAESLHPLVEMKDGKPRMMKGY